MPATLVKKRPPLTFPKAEILFVLPTELPDFRVVCGVALSGGAFHRVPDSLLHRIGDFLKLSEYLLMGE